MTKGPPLTSTHRGQAVGKGLPDFLVAGLQIAGLANCQEHVSLERKKHMTRNRIIAVAGMSLAAIAANASASVTITQQAAPAPTYATTLNFDEVGGPVGVLAGPEYSGIGLNNTYAGAGNAFVDDWNALEGHAWPLGTGNALRGDFGIFMEFGTDVTEFSGQFWDPAGPASPFGGGMGVFVFDDGVEVASWFGNPAWGGVGDTWLDITTDGGMVFDEVRVLGYGFIDFRTTGDNFSWNAVPAPSSCALLGLAGIAAARRRRA